MSRQQSDVQNAVLEVLGAVFRLPREALAGGVAPDRIEGWDSEKHVELVVALEERFGCLFEPEEVPELTSLERIEAIVARHVGTSGS